MLKRLVIITYLLFVIYVVWLMPSEVKSNAMINVVPFKTIRLYVTAFVYGYMPKYIVVGNLLGNIVLFVPMGMLLFHYFRHMGIMTILYLSLYIPLSIEAVQLLLHVFEYGTRTVDIDDVLLNMFGIWIGLIVQTYAVNKT